MKKSILSSKILLLTSSLLLLLLTVGCGEEGGCGKNFSKERKKNTTIQDTERLEDVIKMIAGGALSTSQNTETQEVDKFLEKITKNMARDVLSTSQNAGTQEIDKFLEKIIKKEVADPALSTSQNTETQGVNKSTDVTGNIVSVLNQEQKSDTISQVSTLSKAITEFYNQISSINQTMKTNMDTLHEDIGTMHIAVESLCNLSNELEDAIATATNQYVSGSIKQIGPLLKKITKLLTQGLQIIEKAQEDYSDKSNAIELQKLLDQLLPLHKECEMLKNEFLHLRKMKPDLRLAPGIQQMLEGLKDIYNIQNNDNTYNSLLKQLSRILKIYKNTEDVFISLLEKKNISKISMIESYILNVELAYAYIYGFTVFQELLQKIAQHPDNILSIQTHYNTPSIKAPE